MGAWASEVLDTTDGNVSTFLVEAIDDDGGVHRAEFHGALAKEHALTYAAWKFGHDGKLMNPVRRMYEPRPRPVLTVVPKP